MFINVLRIKENKTQMETCMERMVMNFCLKTMCWNRRLPAWLSLCYEMFLLLNGRRRRVTCLRRFLSIFCNNCLQMRRTCLPNVRCALASVYLRLEVAKDTPI